MNAKKLLTFSAMLLALACSGAAHADTWSSGQEITYLQSAWNGGMSGTPASTLLNTYWDTVYGGSFDTLTVGSTYTMAFDSASAVEAYLPASGAIGPLDASLLNPTTSASGSFGGDVVALTLDVDFSSLTGSSGPAFGNLVITGMPAALSDLNGMTVGQFLEELDILLGGGSLPDGYTIAELDPIAIDIEESFTNGTPDAFAQDNLLPPSTPVPTPEPSIPLQLGVGMLGLMGMALSRKLRHSPR